MNAEANGPRNPAAWTDAAEVAHYDLTSSSAVSVALLRTKIEGAFAGRTADGLASETWLDARFDSVAQQDVMRHIVPRIKDADVLQIGGTGLISLKALIHGARSATLITPSQGELDLTRTVADEFNLSSRLVTIRAFAEKLPLGDGSVDVIVSEASMHHTDLVSAMSEVYRVLRVGGRFGCFEPWRAPLYRWGTSLLGKRDPDVHCRPLDAQRVSGVDVAFPGLLFEWHGALLRYPLIALSKLGVAFSREAVHRLIRADDALTRFLPGFRRRWGSSLSITGVKPS